MNPARLCTLFIAAAVLARGAFADSPEAPTSANLILNGTFASTLESWTTASGQVLAEWSPENSSTDGTGSARLTSFSPNSGEQVSVLSQCVAITPGAYLLQLALRVPSGQSTTGTGRASAAAYANTVCSGSALAPAAFTLAISASSWANDWVAVNVPAGAASLRIVLLVLKSQAGGELEVLADAVQLRNGLLFADGFASGTTAQWSAVVP